MVCHCAVSGSSQQLIPHNVLGLVCFAYVSSILHNDLAANRRIFLLVKQPWVHFFVFTIISFNLS